MRLTVHSLEKTFFDGTVEKTIVNTPMGEITILDGHIPLISALEGPEIKTVDTLNKINIIKIVSGIMEVKPKSEVIILADTKS